VAPGTFKYPGAAIVGTKRGGSTKLEDVAIAGYLAQETGLEMVDFSVANIGKDRSAWLLKKHGDPVSAATAARIPEQGADLMPRTAVCVDVLDSKAGERKVDTPSAKSTWGFTVKGAKELKDARFPGHVATRFIHSMAQSENLLPFVLGEHQAPIAIPAVRTSDGGWKVMSEKDIRGIGLVQTARRFQTINSKLGAVGQGKTLQQRIDERGKLKKQVIGKTGYLVLTGAGGKNICAACVPALEARKLAIDQTLYWLFCESEDEAWYLVGMLNSHAMTEAITPFNPKGDFGERHVHTLPYRLMPPFDPGDEDHKRIVKLARELSAISAANIKSDAYLNDPSRSLSARRAKLRKLLAETKQFQELERLCATSLGTTAFGEETNGSESKADE
jgi:hypothetical protein